MPVILATQEADIRRTTIQSQPRQTVLETLSKKKKITKKGKVAQGRTLSSNPSTAKPLPGS
jgi:hypothetical protein